MSSAKEHRDWLCPQRTCSKAAGAPASTAPRLPRAVTSCNNARPCQTVWQFLAASAFDPGTGQRPYV